jgi:hypothetical protein
MLQRARANTKTRLPTPPTTRLNSPSLSIIGTGQSNATIHGACRRVCGRLPPQHAASSAARIGIGRQHADAAALRHAAASRHSPHHCRVNSDIDGNGWHSSVAARRRSLARDGRQRRRRARSPTISAANRQQRRRRAARLSAARRRRDIARNAANRRLQLSCTRAAVDGRTAAHRPIDARHRRATLADRHIAGPAHNTLCWRCVAQHRLFAAIGRCCERRRRAEHAVRDLPIDAHCRATRRHR